MRKFIFIIALIIVCVGFESCYKEEVIFNAEANRELELPTILKINGKSAHEYTIEDIIYKFQEKDKKKIRLLIERNGTKMKFQFRLNKSV